MTFKFKIFAKFNVNLLNCTFFLDSEKCLHNNWLAQILFALLN